jgi:aspartate carbamoyltransferase catalytic subunit
VSTLSPPSPAPGAPRCHAVGPARPDRKHLLGRRPSAAEIGRFSTRPVVRRNFHPQPQGFPPSLGKIVFNLFFENSTRTRTSFSLAQALSADTQDFSTSLEPVKGDVHRYDQNIEAMGATWWWHPTPEPHLLAQHESLDHQRQTTARASTQGLLDLLTLAPRGESPA